MNVDVETVTTITKTLRHYSEGMAKTVTENDETGDVKFAALLFNLTIGTAASLLEGLHQDKTNLRSAIEAALVSLEHMPDTTHVQAVLAAALMETG